MQTDYKTLLAFAQHLRSHLNWAHVDVSDLELELETIKVFAFHEEQHWRAVLETEVVDGDSLYSVVGRHHFVLRSELVETENGLQDTFSVYEVQEDVEIISRTVIGKAERSIVPPEVSELKEESSIILPGEY